MKKATSKPNLKPTTKNDPFDKFREYKEGRKKAGEL